MGPRAKCPRMAKGQVEKIWVLSVEGRSGENRVLKVHGRCELAIVKLNRVRTR